MPKDTQQPTMIKAPTRDVGIELTLGLGPEDAVLHLAPGSQRADLQPWLLDAVAVKITCLGHHDEVPRPWDWENVLTLLEPGEELLYVLDHHAADSASRPGSFDLWLALRFPAREVLDRADLELREKRSLVVISQIHRQAFPGSEVSWMEPDELLGLLSTSTGLEERCVAVTGMPSPRSLDDADRDIDRSAATRNYQSLNDVVEALYDLGCDYRLAFVVQRVGTSELEVELSQKTTLYDRVHPLVERSVQEGQNWAAQWSENKSFSAAVGESINVQIGASKSETVNAGPAAAAAGAGVGFGLGGPPGAAIGAALGALAGIVSVNDSRSASITKGGSWTHTSTNGSSFGETSGVSLDATTQHVNSLLRLADSSLQRTIEAMHEATGTGAYRWGVFAFADGQNANIVARSLMGVLAGSRTKDHPLVRFEVDGERNRLLTSRTPVMELVAEAAPVLSLPRVCDALLLPEAELPGLRLRRNVFLGRNVEALADVDGLIELGPDAFSTLGVDSAPTSIKVPGGDLFKHVLVAGTTGSGKTTRVVEILNRLENQNLSVVVFETAKRTYRSRLQRCDRPDPLVYSLGSSASHGEGSRFRPLRLNPFFFELGTSLKRHIAVFTDALTELMPTEAMIGPLLRRAVEACYSERGWDIEGGIPIDGAPTWPTVVDLVVHVRRLAEELNYGVEVNANYRGALESRAGLFLDVTFQDIFGYDGDTPIDELFPSGRDAIIEVEELPPSDVDIRAFVMTLLLSRLRSVQGSRRLPNYGEQLEEQEVTSTKLEDALGDHFATKVPRVVKHIKALLRDGKVRVDDEVVRSGSHIISVTSTVKIEREQLDIRRLLSARAKVAVDKAVLKRQVDDKPRKWLVVIEEAHNVLDRQFEQRRPSDESNAGRTLLRAVVRLLQEGREMGIGIMVIDQAPTKLARDVISNTGTKIILRLEDADEMAEVGRAMGLSEDAWQKLGFLQVGEALVKTSYMDHPAKSAGFNKHILSTGPKTTLPANDGWTPSFTALAELWRPVMRGSSSEPQEAWVDALLAAAAGNVRLALFAGLRTLLMEGRASEAKYDASDLRALLASTDLTAASILTCSRSLWSGVVAVHYVDEMINLAATICSALEPSTAWRQASFSGDGMSFAAHALARAGYGAEDEWLWAFGQMQRGSGTARARNTLTQLARSSGGSDRTATVRVLLAMTPEVKKWRSTDPPPSPATLLSALGLSLTSMLITTDVIPEDQRSGADTFVAEIEELLARQVAMRWGETYTHQVEEFLSRMSRFR
jgi:hypothetical protein